ncbi:hypothetical protein EMCRGX_G002522 [Ephydatia muelleri]
MVVMSDESGHETKCNKLVNHVAWGTNNTASMELAVPVVIFVVLVSCCCNVVFLELMIKQDPGAGTTITFVQFLFVVFLVGLAEEGRLRSAPKIPLRKYMRLVALFFVVSVISNYAFVFDVPMPLVMIIKSGSLMTNLVLGMTILKKRYLMSQYIGVFLITVGISIATLASASAKHTLSEYTLGTMSLAENAKVITGVVLLGVSLVLASGMGIIQELMYKEHGKHIIEAMFYTHALPLPGFLIFAPGIWKCLTSFSLSAPIVIGPFAVPSMWVYLLLNAVTQYVCVRAVFTLTASCPSLTVTLVVTLRKFLSLVVSIFYFQNPFTFYHWMGTGAVFLGTFLFSLNDLLPSRHKQD